jgi:hypothetical protein
MTTLTTARATQQQAWSPGPGGTAAGAVAPGAANGWRSLAFMVSVSPGAGLVRK